MSTFVELSDGVRVAVSRYGDGPRHVFFVHGFRNAGSAWAAAIERLPAGVTAVVPDLPGCGASDRPERWERCTIDAYARDVAALIAACGLLRPVLVGHSLGGGIGIRVALDHPDLLGGLVLIAPISTRGFDFLTGEQAERLAHPTDEEVTALALAAFRRRPPPGVLDAVLATVRSASTAHVEGAARSMRDFRVEDALGGLAVPALLVAGDRDRHVPLRNHLATAQAIPRCGLQVFHDVGHVPFVEVPDACADVLARFLAARSA